MDRYTRKDAEKAFERLVKAIGGRIATAYNDIDGYRLDWNSTYGGGNVEQIINAGGAVRQPFGAQRHNAHEFCELVNFAMDVMREKEGR